MTTELRNNASTRASRGFIFWILLMTILAAGFRMYHLDAASLWVDELNTVRALGDIGGINNSKVFGYLATGLGLWSYGARPTDIPREAPEKWKSMGINEWSMRLPAALIGIIGVPILAFASRRLLGTRVAGILALFLAVAPWHIYWSQASRFYTQQFIFFNLSLIWYYRATAESSWRFMLAALVAMVLAFLTQPPALVIVAVFALDWLIALVRHDPVRLGLFGWCGAVVSLAVCAGVFVPDLLNRTEQWTQFSGGLYQSPWKLILGSAFMVGPAVMLFAALSAWGVMSSTNRLRYYLVLAAIVPPIAFALVSLKYYVGLRYAFVSLYAWLALAAIGVDRMYEAMRPHLGRLAAAAPMLLLLIAMGLMNFDYYRGGMGYHTRWRDAFAFVAEHRGPEELVATEHPMIGKYYLEDPAVINIPREEELDSVAQPLWIVTEKEDAVRGRLRAWLDGKASLKETFDLRIDPPFSSVRVYYYLPRREDDPQGAFTSPNG
jgi:hypothetical protein